MGDHDASDLITKERFSEMLQAAGLPSSIGTIRNMRATWPDGECEGPAPVKLSPRRLRYRRKDAERYIREKLDEALRVTRRGQRGE